MTKDNENTTPSNENETKLFAARLRTLADLVEQDKITSAIVYALWMACLQQLSLMLQFSRIFLLVNSVTAVRMVSQTFLTRCTRGQPRCGHSAGLGTFGTIRRRAKAGRRRVESHATPGRALELTRFRRNNQLVVS